MYQDAHRQALAMIAATHATLPHVEKTAYLAGEAARMGVSMQTLYRQLKSVGWSSGRKTRTDKGTFTLDDATLNTIGGLQKVGIRKNGKAVMKIPTAVSILTLQGQEISVSNATIARNLRAKRIDLRSQQIDTPAIEQRSLHPNHVHEVDPSLCLLFYMRGRQHIVREDEFYKNKLDALAKNPLKVWRYVLADHFSARYVLRYYERAGEDQRTLADFLMYAWQMIGVPRCLMMDPGSANTAYTIQNLCKALEVKVIVNLPKGPRAKGAVERGNGVIEESFESRLRVEPVASVEALNEIASAWVDAFNANLIPGQDTRLRREGLAMAIARMDLFRTIKPEELRHLPPLEQCVRLMFGKTIERKVDAELRVTFRHPMAERSMPYDVRGLAGVSRGDLVKVSPLAYGLAAILIEVTRYDGQALTYRLEPIADWTAGGFRESSPIIGEEYHALPKTELERAAETLDRAAYGVDADGVVRNLDEIDKAKTNKHVVPFKHVNGGAGFQTFDRIKAIAHPAELPKRGEVIEPSVPPIATPQGTHLEASGVSINVPSQMNVPAQRLNLVQIAKEGKRVLGDLWTAGAYQQVAEWYPEGCLEEELPEVFERLRRGNRMRLVS